LPVPLKIVKARLNRGSWEILVSWKDRPSSETTWEKVGIFKISYPDIQHEDELFFGEGGNVIDALVGRTCIKVGRSKARKV
jgi:hypothetical protein